MFMAMLGLHCRTGFSMDVACMLTKSFQLCLTFCDPWTAAHQAPLSMGFSRQEYWDGLPQPPPGDLPQPRNQTLVSCTAGAISKAQHIHYHV